MNFYALIDKAATATPNALAIRWPLANSYIDLTFTQLTQRVNAARQTLQTRNIRTGDICMVAIPVSLQAIVVTLALMAEGAVPLLPPAGMRFGQWKRIRKQYQVKAIVTNPSPAFKVKLLCLFSQVKLTKIGEGLIESSRRASTEVVDTQTALITFSSGSTGHPKAIERSHAVLVHQHQAILNQFPTKAGQLDFPLFPNILLHNLAAGLGTVMPRIPSFRLEALSPEAVIHQLRQEKVHSLTGNVFYFTRLIAYALRYDIQLPTVEAVGVGGSPVPEPLLRQLQQVFCSATVYVIYGSSEAEPIAVRAFTDSKDPLLGYAVGEIHQWLEYKLNFISPLSKAGELLVKGPHVVLPSGKEWFATGDIGYVQDGILFLTARRGNERVIDGKQHYQLEHYLQHLEGMRKVAALAREHTFNIVYEGGTEIATVRAALHRVIAPHCIGKITRMDALPVDRRHHSKILYHQLKK